MHPAESLSQYFPHSKSSLSQSSSQPHPLALVTAVDQFLGYYLAHELIKQGIYVLGLPSIFTTQTVLPESLISSKYFFSSNLHSEGFPQSPLIQSDLIPDYLFLTDLYASSFSASQLNQAQVTSLLRHQLQLLPYEPNSHIKITYVSPYFNPQLKTPPFPFTDLHLPFIFQQLNSLDRKPQINFRTVLLADCYGSNYDLNGQQPLSQVFSAVKFGVTRRQLSVSPHTKIYPLHVQDAVQALIKITLMSNTKHQQFVLAHHHSYPLESFLHLLQQIVPHRTSFSYSAQPPSAASMIDPRLIRRTCQRLHWQPEIALEHGLQMMGDWLKPPILLTKPASQPWDGMHYEYLKVLEQQSAFSGQFAPSDSQSQLSKNNLFLNFKKTFSKLKPPRFTFGLSRLFGPVSRRLPAVPNLSYAWKPALVVLIVLTLIVPPTVFGYTLIQGGLFLNQSLQQIQSGNFTAAAQESDFAQARFQQLGQGLGFLSFASHLPYLGTKFDQALAHIRLAQLSSETIFESSSSLLLLQTSLRTTLDPSLKTDPLVTLDQARMHLTKTQTLLGELQAVLPDHLPFYLRQVVSQPTYTSLKVKLPLVRGQLATFIYSLGQYPALAGYQKPQTYLVIFQNNRELRPTGGFIGSVGLLTLDQGQLTNWTIHDVYDADGQLLGYVEPPGPIHQYLGEASWYLRDANWDPDFPTTSEKLQWFVKKELKQSVSGVLAVDVDFIQNLVGAMNSVYLPDQQITLTADNFYQYLQQKSEGDHFPGSHQKGDHLSLVADAILYKLKHGPQLDWVKLATALNTGFQSKHALAYFDHLPAQDLISQLGWSGSLQPYSYTTSNIAPLLSQVKQLQENTQVLSARSNLITDHLLIVEANLGVNKVNQYLERQIFHHIKLQETASPQETLQIFYHNQSQPDSWLGGAYKNYLRLYLPLGTALQNLQLGVVTDPHWSPESDQSSADLPAIDLDFIDHTQEHGYEVYGFLAPIPPQTYYLVRVDYSLPSQSLPNQFTYRLQISKQAGSQNDPYWLTVQYPVGFQPTNTTQSSSDLQSGPAPHLTDNQTIRYNISLSQDQTIDVSFNKHKIRSL